MKKQTTNAFIFSWCEEGIEAIVPITQFENLDEKNARAETFNILAGEEKEKIQYDPLPQIITHLTMRARANSQRHYEIYSVDCASKTMDIDFWQKQWDEYPQETADLIREKGVKIYSDRREGKPKIT